MGTKPAGAFKHAKDISSKAVGLELPEKPKSFESRPKFADKPDDPDRGRRQLDPLTERLQCNGYFHKMRFAWLKQNVRGVNYALEFSRYYQEKNLAIDIDTKEDKEIVELKRALCVEHKIRYLILETATDFKTLNEFLKGVA